MAAALTLLLIGSVLQGALCGVFKVTIPQTIEVLSGSCVTIPCSFDVEDKYESYLDNTCNALWGKDRVTVFDSSKPHTTLNNGQLTGNLTKKDCTTTLNNIQPGDNNKKYFFRVECNNVLKYTFPNGTSISVRDDPPTPTLTPSTLEVKGGTSVSLTCSAPAPCLSHPPTLTWTPGLGVSQETLQENPDKTKVQTSVVSFTASHLHHGKTISCTATYNKQDGSTNSPKNTTVSVHPSGPVQENKNVTLMCSSSANPPVKTYTWYRADGGHETFIGTGHVLNIKASRDNSPFFCEAQNDLGAGRSSNRQIDVQYSPQNTTLSVHPSGPVQENKHVTLTCSSSANPPVKTYIWYRADGGHETFIGTGHVLNIKVSKNNSLFFCKAENDLGAGRSNNRQIDVQYSPKHTAVSVHPSGPVPEGRDVTLTCSSSANPPVKNYTWYRADGGHKTFIGAGAVLNITASKDDSSFFYEAQNDLGAGRSNISQIDVQFSPQILPSSHCTIAEAQLRCSCRTVGNPSPALQWYLDGLPVNRSFARNNLNDTGLMSNLTVDQPQEKNLSTLLCRSYNSLGSASQRICINSIEPHTSLPSQVLLLAVAGVSLCVNVLYTVCIALLWRARQHVKPKEEDRTYMSLNQRDISPEYDVIAQTTPK